MSNRVTRFLQRVGIAANYASAVYAMMLSVRPPSHSGVLSRRTKLRSCGFHRQVGQSSSFWRGKDCLEIRRGSPLASELKCSGLGGVVALSVECRTYDQEVVGSSLGRARGVKTLGKFFTPMCLCSPSSISWYRPKAVMPCGWGVKTGMVRVGVAGKTV